MNIENIQTFLKIIENKSFTRTAEEMFCSQAAVSLRIKKLEEYLDVELFLRDNKKFNLTNEGKIFIPHARQIIQSVKDARKNIFISRNMNGISINISSSSTPGTYLFPDILYKFRQKYPESEIINQVQYTKDVVRDVIDHKYTIGFISQPSPFKHDNLLCKKILSDPLCLIVSVQHPWAERQIVPMDEIKNEKILVSNHKSSIISYIESLGGFVFPRENIHVVGNIEAIKRGVVENKGIALISSLTVKSELNFNMLKEIPIEKNSNISRHIYSVIRKDSELSLAEEVFLDFVKESL